MNYYLDTEFLEGTQTKRFLGLPYGNTKPTIELTQDEAVKVEEFLKTLRNGN